MGLSTRSAAYMPQSEQAPQTGINPNPPAVTASAQPAGKGGAAFAPPVPEKPAAPVMVDQQAAAGAMAAGTAAPSYAENVYTPQQAPQGKAGGPGQAQGSPAATSGKGGAASMTNSATSGQPQMGVPNKYSNTVQPMDNRGMGIAGLQARGKGM